MGIFNVLPVPCRHMTAIYQDEAIHEFHDSISSFAKISPRRSTESISDRHWGRSPEHSRALTPNTQPLSLAKQPIRSTISP